MSSQLQNNGFSEAITINYDFTSPEIKNNSVLQFQCQTIHLWDIYLYEISNSASFLFDILCEKPYRVECLVLLLLFSIHGHHYHHHHPIISHNSFVCALCVYSMYFLEKETRTKILNLFPHFTALDFFSYSVHFGPFSLLFLLAFPFFCFILQTSFGNFNPEELTTRLGCLEK